ncbi:hypothetical protein BsWGS_05204 [Bradybaena similaris]
MTDLNLSYCSGLALSPECEVLWTLPQTLTCLSLCGLMLKDEDILVESVTRLPCLTSLKICGVPALNDDTLTKIVKKIGHKLIDLNLSGIGNQEITDTGLKSVARFCTMLKSLCIFLLRQVTGLEPIFTDHERASRIHKLSISCKLMDISMLDCIMVSCPNLVLLELPNLSTVSDEMIINLADHSPKLTHLDLSGCKQVTDAAICYLSGCCPLTSVSLSGLIAITDKTIFSLASNCPQLEEIFLNGCAHVSPAAVQYLKDCCLGRLYASHNIPNADPYQVMARNLDTGEFCRADLL